MGAIVLLYKQYGKFPWKQLFVLICFLSLLFVVSHFFVVKAVAEKTMQWNYAELTEIAKEIYDKGEVTEAIKDIPLDEAAITKMSAEIERILSKTSDYPNCELYFLKVKLSGNYPVLGYGNSILGFEYMNTGNVWKVGQTRNGQTGRYPQDIYCNIKQLNVVLGRNELEYITVKYGNYKEILILEKILIYTYPLWSGHITLMKPPGCKIYR